MKDQTRKVKVVAQRMLVIIRLSLVTLYGQVHMHLVLLLSAVRKVLLTGVIVVRKNHTLGEMILSLFKKVQHGQRKKVRTSLVV